MKLSKYLIIIPAYNEGPSIEKVIDETRESMPDAEMLIVNDGSNDDTAYKSLNKGVNVVNLPFNIGYGCALQTGFRFAEEYNFDYVITMDGDGQHDPKSINNLVDAIKTSDADIVIGSRFLKGDYKMTFARKLGALLFGYVARLYTGIRITDPTSGFQLLNRQVFTYLAQGDNYPLDYPDVNIIMALHKKRFKVVEAPVIMREKNNGKSMHSGIRPLIYVVRMILAILIVLLRKED